MSTILREVGMIYRCFESIANIEFKDYKLSKNQYIYLVRICEQPGIILERLSDLLKVDRSTASRAVQKLHQAGFVCKVDENASGKSIQLFPSRKGKQVYAMLQSDEAYSSQTALQGFSHAEQDQLLAFLERIRQNIEPDWELVKRGGRRQYAKAPLTEGVEILDYDDSHQAAFKHISCQWLEKYVSVEPEDEKILNHPRTYVLDPGGCIFMAAYHGELVGCVALIPAGPQTFEIAKLGVLEGYQNLGIGRQLMCHALDRACQLGAQRLILFTNTKLETAIRLYEQLGFTEIPDLDHKYLEADLKMALDLNRP